MKHNRAETEALFCGLFSFQLLKIISSFCLFFFYEFQVLWHTSIIILSVDWIHRFRSSSRQPTDQLTCVQCEGINHISTFCISFAIPICKYLFVVCKLLIKFMHELILVTDDDPLANSQLLSLVHLARHGLIWLKFWAGSQFIYSL